jgi:agmatine/peptidylarginine deiminase
MLLPEWYPQSAIQLTWPHQESDWADNFHDVKQCFIELAKEISLRQKLLVVCRKESEVKPLLSNCTMQNILFVEQDSNDSWARDHGGIVVMENEKPVVLDFGFNGWGGKYPADRDNKITKALFENKVFTKNVQYSDKLDFILEGGSIESDGKGTILTTSSCLLSPSRNGNKSKQEIEQYLHKALGVERVLWLNHGHLVGDDTDGHIDTLARFCNSNTIAYVKCVDPEDEHFDDLAKMENELQVFKTLEGKPYNLIPLPMADPIYEEGQRLPATYANFLMMNEAVLLPFYGINKDHEAKKILQSVFSDREVIGINCSSLIKQNGSLHCVTMQYPEGVIS